MDRDRICTSRDSFHVLDSFLAQINNAAVSFLSIVSFYFRFSHKLCLNTSQRLCVNASV